MKVTPRSRLQIRIQNIAFVVLFLAAAGLLAWLSTRYTYVADWTASGRNTLSEASTAVLEAIEGPVTVTAFVREGPDSDAMRARITDIVARYQRVKDDLTLEFINPDLEPQLVRDLAVSVEGELVIRHGKQSENLQNLTEQRFTNALQRVARDEDRWLVFVEGHGERSPRGQANHDLGEWVSQLENRGLKVRTINLGTTPSIPDNTTVLVIAGPQVKLLPGEIELIDTYLNAGGNLLWLADPGPGHGLEPIAERLGIEFHPGMIVDPATRIFGINDPRFALVAEYSPHPLMQDFNLLTIFPQAAGIDLRTPDGWEGATILASTAQSWSETSELTGAIQLDEGVDIPGPLPIGVALNRDIPEEAAADSRPASEAEAGEAQPAAQTGGNRQQRVVVIGDGDFLSNAYLGNSGNLDLGLRIVNWLSRDDTYVAIPAKTTPGRTLELSTTATAAIGFGFLLVVPVALVGIGLGIWLRRRKR